MRAVIIDDQAAIRQSLEALLSGQPDMQVVGQAGDGEEGLKVVFQTQPDVILLDLEMPRMDGFQFLRLLMAKRPVPVVVISSHSTRESVFRALELGAMEFVAKPISHGTVDLNSIREDLLHKVRLARRLQVVTLVERTRSHTQQLAQSIARSSSSASSSSGPVASALGAPMPGPMTTTDRLLCIGASTGGPTSILTLLQGLSPELPVSVLITQHMPEKFTAAFAERLKRTTPWDVSEATVGAPVLTGRALVAAGTFSLRVGRDGAGLRVQEPAGREDRADGYVPSVDQMLQAAARVMGAQVIAVVLTGMSGDGVRGAVAVRAAGGVVLVEEPQTAVVASMPEEVIRAGAVDEVVPLQRMAEAIERLVRLGPAR